MMKNVILRYPDYLKEFKCIAGDCEDSCCIGWDIDIDKISFKKYFKVEHEEMKRMFQKNIQNNKYCTSDDVDYGKVKLQKGKRCAFLDENNYCKIYSNIGEEYLSNVCTCYPRITNKINNFYEMSLDVACPEAARILLLKEDGISFSEGEETLGKHIVSSSMDLNSKEFNNTPMKYFLEIRDICIKIIQNRKYSISDRLYILGDFLEKLDEEIDENLGRVNKFINSYNINPKGELYEKNKFNYVIQVSFLNQMLKILKVEREIDSEKFKEYTRELIKNFKLENPKDITNNTNMYIESFEEFIDNFMNNHSYIFENYLVNFIYNNLFPFSENSNVFDGYIMLLMRFSFIRFYLAGMYSNGEKVQVGSVVRFIQVFSKAIGHHKTYMEDVLAYIKNNEFDNMEFVKTLL